jgi:hypothetical protein
MMISVHMADDHDLGFRKHLGPKLASISTMHLSQSTLTRIK